MSAQPRSVASPGNTAGIERVSTLELFFDLVFVFTLTELTDALVDEPTWSGVSRTMLLLAVIWWMYGGYAWLTNAVRADRVGRQALLLGGMGGFFVIALAVPDAFERPGPAFGTAYLAVVVVHAALFSRSASGSVVAGIFRIARLNLLAAVAVLVGLMIGDAAAYLGLAAAVAVTWGWSAVRRPTGFDIGAAHFVERHGLIVIIAIGESIVSVGVGIREAALGTDQVLAALLGLGISAGLWWTYFGAGREEQAEAALAHAEPAGRSRMALDGFGLCHYGLLLGVVLLAAGLKTSVAAPRQELELAASVFLAAGMSVFLLASLAFRLLMGLAVSPLAFVLGIACTLATAALGTSGSAGLQLVALALVPFVLGLAEARLRRPGERVRPAPPAGAPSPTGRSR